MKVQVNIEYPSGHQCHSETKLTLDVKLFDSVASLKQRLALVEPIPFHQELILGDEALADQQKFGDLDVKEGQQLRLKVRASEDMFGEQLAKLLEDRPLSVSELGLLYCHQHGATAIQALQILGSQEQLADYIGRSKRFSIEKSGLVGLAQKTTAPQRLDCISEAQEQELAACVVVRMHLTAHAEGQEGCTEDATVSLKATSTDTPQNLCRRALEAECIPFEPKDVAFQGKALNLEDSLQKCKIGDGDQLHVALVATPEYLLNQLASVLKPRKTLSVTELSDHYCYKFGAPVFRALRLLGLKGQLKEFLKNHPDRFTLEAGCVSLK